MKDVALASRQGRVRKVIAGQWHATVILDDGTELHHKLCNPHPETPRRNKKMRTAGLAELHQLIRDNQPTDSRFQPGLPTPEVGLRAEIWAESRPMAEHLGLSATVAASSIAAVRPLVSEPTMPEGKIKTSSIASTWAGTQLEERRTTSCRSEAIAGSYPKLALPGPDVQTKSRASLKTEVTVLSPAPVFRMQARTPRPERPKKAGRKRLGGISGRTSYRVVGQLDKKKNRLAKKS